MFGSVSNHRSFAFFGRVKDIFLRKAHNNIHNRKRRTDLSTENDRKKYSRSTLFTLVRCRRTRQVFCHSFRFEIPEARKDRIADTSLIVSDEREENQCLRIRSPKVSSIEFTFGLAWCLECQEHFIVESHRYAIYGNVLKCDLNIMILYLMCQKLIFVFSFYWCSLVSFDMCMNIAL